MFEFSAEKITQMLEAKNIIVKDRAVYKYGIEKMIAYVTSILLLLIVGIIYNCIIEVIIYEVVFLIIKRFTGGYYFTTYIESIGLYALVFSLYLIIKENLKISVGMVCIIVIIAIVIIISLSPVQSSNDELTELKQRRYHLYSTLLSIIIGISCIVLRVLNIPLYLILTYSFSWLSFQILGGKIIYQRNY